MQWNERSGCLVVNAREGRFPEMVNEREYRILFISANGTRQHRLLYKGDEVCLRMDEVDRCD
jgi:hypothetical protein